MPSKYGPPAPRESSFPVRLAASTQPAGFLLYSAMQPARNLMRLEAVVSGTDSPDQPSAGVRWAGIGSWGGRARWIEPEPTQHEGQDGSRKRSEGDHTDQTDERRESHEQVVFPVGWAHLLPQVDAKKSNATEHCSQHNPGSEFATNDAPPVAKSHLTERHGTDHQGRGL